MKAQNRYTWFRALGSLLLLSGYFLNVISFESFHQSVHHHNHTQLHTKAAEADACHRAIYHGEFEADCHHKSHVSKGETDCELCKVTVSRFHFSPNGIIALAESLQTACIRPASTGFFGNDCSLAVAPRGPPALS